MNAFCYLVYACIFLPIATNNDTVNILMRITKARDGVVKAILGSRMTYTLDSCFGFFQELRQVAGWILKDQPSLHEIQLRLEEFQVFEEPSSEEALVEDTLQRCWSALRSAREEAKDFLQQFVVQEDERVRSNNDGTCKSGECRGTSRPETDSNANDEHNNPRVLHEHVQDSVESYAGVYFGENRHCDVQEDWMEVSSDTDSIQSNQTI